jgi:rhodanese-related sulfurtransferase
VPATKPAPTPAPEQARATLAPITEISSQEAWQAFQAGLPFLDARRSGEFSGGHLPGAWNTPVWEADLDDRLLDFKAQRRPGAGDAIVIYCSGGDCQDSQLLAEKLLAQGYFHLLIYREGYPDWVARSRPVERGGR